MTVAAIDAGTTGVRCMIVGTNGEVMSISRMSWEYTTPEGLEIAKEFDPNAFWKMTCTVVRQALKESKLSPSKIEAVATTSQRHGAVFLDSDGKEVYAGPNIDARGALSQYVIEDALEETYHKITGCWPPLMFAPARLAWFEEEEPEIFESIAHILPISDWITYRLSGVFVTDPSSGSGTGFLDINKREWSKEVTSILGVDTAILPEIREAGDLVGRITVNGAKDCGLPEGLPVVQGGADTHCALLACQGEIGDVMIISGSTTPVMLVVDNPLSIPDQRMWTGCHIIPGLWTIESNATMTGALLEWAVRLLCERAEAPEKCVQNTFDNLSEIVRGTPLGSHETMVALGPSIMDCRRITDIPQARMFFPQPALPQIVPLDSSSFLHAILENISYAVRGNFEQISEYADIKSIKVIGGLTRAHVWPQLLSNVLDRGVSVPLQSEGSLLGAAICAARGAGLYNTLTESAESMVQWHPLIEPDEKSCEYNSYYEKWKKLWHERE
ncbi:MAG: FGGY-family carbohydrate kinase [Candidatus Thorarchaeota archaeon]|jgi:autoinducer 2 (AI-2) kinase